MQLGDFELGICCWWMSITWLIVGNRIRFCGGTTEENGYFCPPPNFIVEGMGISGIILIELLVAGVEFL